MHFCSTRTRGIDHMLNYNKLRYFYTVANHLNFTNAAKELFISQSAVSRHMRELEEELHAELFIRTNRNLILTDAGKILLEEVSSFFSREEELIKKVRAAANKTNTELSIGFMGIQPAFHMSSISNEMIMEYPNLTINMRRYNMDEVETAIHMHEIDIALRLRMGSFDDINLEHLILDSAPPAIVVSKRHPLSNKKTADLAEFRNDRLLMLSEKDSAVPYRYTKTLFERHHLKPKDILVYDQVETILMMIHSDAGISLLSKFAATDQFSDLCIIDINIKDHIDLELIWRKNDDNPLIPVFAEKLRATFWSLS